jgi:hypothetical protein
VATLTRALQSYFDSGNPGPTTLDLPHNSACSSGS